MESEPLAEELSDQDRLLLVFAYLGPLALVSLAASRREFVKWHAKQGIVLTAIALGLYPVLRFVQFILNTYILRVFGEMFRAGIWLVVLGGVVVLALCIIRGLEGERFKIPVLGDLADRL